MNRVIASLVLLMTVFLIGNYTSQDAKAQTPPFWASYLSLVDLDDGTGNLMPTIQITGANLRIVNGMGTTNGYSIDPDSTDPVLTSTNGTGNLIIGYNEFGNPDGDDRTGSHNIVFGHGNSFTRFGGIVGPKDNTISGAFASVIGGRDNTASSLFSSVTGGISNTASGRYSSVSAGRLNMASGDKSSVSGGRVNTASRDYSSISGGTNNLANGAASSVSGGGHNTAYGPSSSVSGGENNLANTFASSVSGGRFNTAYGNHSSISGGYSRSVSGTHDWRAGSLFEDY